MAGINLNNAHVLRGEDANGEAVSGALLTVYEAGTTTTVTTYSDSALTTANASPVVADSSGSWGPIYVPAGLYKIDVTDSGGTSLPGYPEDNVSVPNAVAAIDFDIRTDVTTTQIAASVDAVRTSGYTTIGDGGGAFYKRVGAEPSHEFKVQSSDGAWFEGVPEHGGVFPEQVGATADGSTDDSTAFTNALAVTGVVLLRDASYRLSAQFLIEGSGKAIVGVGKDKSILIVGDGAGNAGIRFNNAIHCTTRDLTIQSNDDTGPGVELDETSGNCISNVFLNVRFIGNSGGARPAITQTAHVAVRGVEAAAGQGNYFHRFTGCDFDSWFAAFHADYNANAWLVDNCKAQAVWRCFRGGFQEWAVSNFWWHSSAGADTNKAFFVEGFGKSASNRMFSNVFSNIIAEPGATLTEFWSMNADTLSNIFLATHQCTADGTDSGTTNHLIRYGTGRYEKLTAWRVEHSGDYEFGGVGNAGNVNLYGDGTTSRTGTARKLKVWGGGITETRHGEVYQAAGGDFVVESAVAGKLKLIGIGGVEMDLTSSGLTLTNATTQSTVGGAGGASAVPANPNTYLVVNIGGTELVIPAFAKA